MRLRFTKPARQRIRTVQRWWRENRPDTPRLFVQELRAALDQIRDMPGIGQLYETRPRARGVVRRIRLEKTSQYVYYSADPANDEILIHTVWGAKRGRGPRL